MTRGWGGLLSAVFWARLHPRRTRGKDSGPQRHIAATLATPDAQRLAIRTRPPRCRSSAAVGSEHTLSLLLLRDVSGHGDPPCDLQLSTRHFIAPQLWLSSTLCNASGRQALPEATSVASLFIFFHRGQLPLCKATRWLLLVLPHPGCLHRPRRCCNPPCQRVRVKHQRTNSW